MTRETIDSEKLLRLCTMWQERACEAIDVLVADEESFQMLRDAVVLTCGSLIGQLIMCGLDLDCVRACATKYFVACEAHLAERLPEFRNAAPWPTLN